MSAFHSTVSRRDFMKLLGLAGAGAGAAMAVNPAYTDLDELTASSVGNWKRSWWVREVDTPTAEVDWQVMPYFDNRETMFDSGAFRRYIGEEEFNRLNQLVGANQKAWVQQNRPGFTLRDVAFNSSTGFGYAYGLRAQFVQSGVTQPEAFGVARWSATAEENTNMIRAAARFFGARDVGVYELDQNTRKTVYSHERDGKAYVFRDAEASESSTERVIPYSAKYVIIFSIMESQEMMKRAPDNLSSASVSLGYAQGALVNNRLQNFINRLGYQCLAESMSNAMVQCAGAQALAGVAEIGRMSLSTLNPDFGPIQRAFKVITDLPLAPTKPIDSGMLRFCKTCMLCADACPPSAISLEKDPSYDIKGPWNKPGIEHYYYDGAKCLSWWRNVTTGCSTCRSACPFAAKNFASIHDFVVKPVQSVTPLFNGFFAEMDKFFGYEGLDEEGFSTREVKNSWWNIANAPVYGFDTARMATRLQ